MAEALEIASGIVHAAWMLVVTIVLYKLWDRMDDIPGSADPDEQLADEWQPVDLSDEREHELQQQEKRRNLFR